MTGFTRKVEPERILVVYPEGTGRFKTRPLTWNVGHCCGHALEKRVDDVGFISALIDKLSAPYPVDPARIYVTGTSNGAMMSRRIGSCHRGSRRSHRWWARCSATKRRRRVPCRR